MKNISFFAVFLSFITLALPANAMDSDLARAIAASLANLAAPIQNEQRLRGAKPYANQHELISACDFEHTRNSFSTNKKDIRQLPVLFQAYESLHDYRFQAQSKTYTHCKDLCGVYALWFASVFANSSSIDELNNRAKFEIFLAQAADMMSNINKCAMLSSSEIEKLAQALLSGNAQSSLLVEQFSTSTNDISKKEEAFIEGRIPYLTYILNTGTTGHGSHWITILIKKNPMGNIEFTIADSLAIDRMQPNNPVGNKIFALYQKLDRMTTEQICVDRIIAKSCEPIHQLVQQRKQSNYSGFANIIICALIGAGSAWYFTR